MRAQTPSWHRGYSALASAALAATAGTTAVAQTTGNIDVGVGALVASDPFLRGGDDTAAAAANLTVDPSVRYEGEATTVTMRGHVRLDQYFDQYGLDESAMGRIDGTHRFDERTKLSVMASASSARSVSRNLFALTQPGSGEPAAGEFPEQPIIDPTLGGIGGRTNNFAAGTSLERLLSPTSTLRVGGRVGLTRITQGFGQDYRDAAFTMGYAYRLSERSAVTVNAEFSQVDYLDRRTGDGRFVTVMGGIERRLGEALRVSGQLGVTSVWVNSPMGTREQSTSLAASLDLCNQNTLGSLCISASRRAQPTAASGISTVTAFGASYVRTLGLRSRVSLSGNYARSTRSLIDDVPASSGGSEIVGVTATYSRDLSNRVSAFVSPSFHSVSHRDLARRENVQVMAGIRFRLGRLR